ncbi:MAG: rRNA adenine dimethyltransferase family protein [Elusimicrobiota bacterium]
MRARLDQHFLKDHGVRDRILAAARLEPGDSVVEIGPGRGFLTAALLARAPVTAVEMDERLAAALGANIAAAGGPAPVPVTGPVPGSGPVPASGSVPSAGLPPGLRLIVSDFLKVEPRDLGKPPLKFVSNLPYSVATPILQRILSWDCWSSAVLMFQKEVAERIIASPGGRDYGVLTLSTAIKASAELVTFAPCEAFSPKPKVESAVVRLTRRAVPLVPPEGESAFFRVCRAAFSQRRKKVINPLASAFPVSRERIAAVLEECGIPASARAEEIPLDGFLRLAAKLGSSE